MVDSTIRIKVDGSGASADVSKLDGQFKGLKSTVSAVAAAIAAALAVENIKNYADAWTKASNQIKQATNSIKEAERATNAIFNTAQSAAVSIDGVATSYQRLTAAVSELGFNQQQILQVVDGLTKAFKANGASAQEANSVIVQLGQGLGTGVLQGDELKSILEASIPVANALAKEFGVTRGQLKRLGEEGKLDAKKVFDALLKGSKDFDDAYKKSTATFEDGTTRITNSLTKYIGELDKAIGLSQGFNAVASDFANNIPQIVEALGSIIKVGIAAYLTSLTPAIIATGTAFVASTAQAVAYQLTLGTMAGYSRTATVATLGLAGALNLLKAAIPFGIILLGVEALSRWFTNTNDAIVGNDRLSASMDKLNARYKTFTERENAIALREAAEKLADFEDRVQGTRDKLAEVDAKIASVLDGSLKMSTFDFTRLANQQRVIKIELSEQEQRLKGINAEYDKLQAKVGGEANISGSLQLGEITKLNKTEAPTQKGSTEAKKLAAENQITADFLNKRVELYNQYRNTIFDFESTDFQRRTAQADFELESEKLRLQASLAEKQNTLLFEQQQAKIDFETKKINRAEYDAIIRELDTNYLLFKRETEFNILQAEQDRSAQSIALAQAEAEQKIALEEQVLNYKVQAAQSVLSLGEAVFSKQTAIGKAVKLAQAGISAYQIYANSNAAAFRALAELGPIAGPPVASSIKIAGIASAAAVVASAAKDTFGGGSGGGGVSIPTVSSSTPQTAATPTQQNTPSQQAVTYVSIAEDSIVTGATVIKLLETVASNSGAAVAINATLENGKRMGAI